MFMIFNDVEIDVAYSHSPTSSAMEDIAKSDSCEKNLAPTEWKKQSRKVHVLVWWF